MKYAMIRRDRAGLPAEAGYHAQTLSRIPGDSCRFRIAEKRRSQVSIVDALSGNLQGNLSMRSPAVRNSGVAPYDTTTTPSLRKLAGFIAIEPFVGFDPDLLVNIADAECADVQRARALCRARLLTELDDPLH